MGKRIYVASPVNGGRLAENSKPRLINATNPAVARQHATKSLYEIKVATQQDVAKLVKDGVEVEEAGDGHTDPLPGTAG
jgi:hypothetical protein